MTTSRVFHAVARVWPSAIASRDADQGSRSNATLGLFLAVLFHVSLHCLFSVPSGVNHVAPRCVCMVCCLLVVSGIVMLGGFPVVPCGMREMF
jgi:hypothetical protein